MTFSMTLRFDFSLPLVTPDAKDVYKRQILDIQNDTWWQHPLHEVTISPDPTKHALIEMKTDHFILVHIDAIFPILHGKNGEDGTVQGLIALSGIPLIGCSVAVSYTHLDVYKRQGKSC